MISMGPFFTDSIYRYMGHSVDFLIKWGTNAELDWIWYIQIVPRYLLGGQDNDIPPTLCDILPYFFYFLGIPKSLFR